MESASDNLDAKEEGSKTVQNDYQPVPDSPSLLFTTPKRFDDEMNYEELKKLELMFNKDGIGLNAQQFRHAMKIAAGYDIDDAELNMIFMKVDTNSDGTVDWDEYLSFMLLEYQEKENMLAIYGTTPFPHPMTTKSSNHLESICSISLQQHYSVRYDGRIEFDDEASRYMTLSKDGVLNVWSTEWKLQKSTMFDCTRTNPRSVWFTDLVCMPNCNSIAVASTDYEITFYSLASNIFQKKFQIRDMDYCALNLDYQYKFGKNKSVLVWGDTSGSVVVVKFYDNPSLALFSSTFVNDKKLTLNGLLKTPIHNVKVARFQNVLPEWVKEVHFYLNDKEQEFFVACCRSNAVSMVFADITEKFYDATKRKMEMRRKSCFSLRNGVSCVAYDTDWNLVATGSSDFHVRIWNPYVVTAPTMILKGHAMPVQHIYIRNVDHHVISVSKDKNIRVWSLLDYSCKQSIHGRHIQLGRLDIAAMFYNESNLQLVLGSNVIGVLVGNSSNLTQATKKRMDPISHPKPITKVLYNDLFKMLVTSSEDSMICVWDVRTGAKTMQFSTDLGCEISAMAFDPSRRRLITGSRNGRLCMWNFNNGARLRNFRTGDVAEVSEIIHAKNRIISTGWDKSVTIHHDSYSDASFKRMKRSHKDDVLSMDFHKSDNVLATSSYDGEIIIWSIDLGSVICRLDMNFSIFPCYENRSKFRPSCAAGKSSIDPSISESSIFIYLPHDLPWLHENSEMGLFQQSSQEVSSDELATKNKAVNKVLFLQSRRTSNNVAILFAASMGYVLAWSLHQTGGILAFFNAVNDSCDTLLEMESDETNKVLITGDSRGYLKVWDIQNFCNGDDIDARRKNLNKTRPLMSVNLSKRYYYDPISTPPELITSYRGHCKPITSLAYIKGRELIASGSSDCSVRLWTLRGRYVGTFGQGTHWSMTTPVNERALPAAIPMDVRRVASPSTLFTIKGGYHHHWKHVRHAVDFIGRFRRLAKCFQVKSAEPEEKTIEQKLSQVSTDLVENSKPDVAGGSRRGSVTVWMADRPHSIEKTVKKQERVDTMWRDIQDHGITSSVLGKVNYKPRRRHKTPTKDTKVVWMDKSAIIYNNLPCADLEEPLNPTMPEYFMKKLASQNAPTLSRFGHKVLERKKLMGTFNPRRLQSGQSIRRSSKKRSSMELE